MNATEFGKFIQSLRKEQGMTQAQLAEKLMVTDKAISRWERGIGFPDISLLEPLAEALGITIVELMRSERIEAAAIPLADADSLMTDTIELASEQKRHQWRSRMLKFGAIPLVVLADAFFSALIGRYVTEPLWLRALGIGVLGYLTICAVAGIWYIASFGYLKPAQPPKPAALYVIVALALVGMTLFGFGGYLAPVGRKLGAAVQLVGLISAIICPLYLFHMISEDFIVRPTIGQSIRNALRRDRETAKKERLFDLRSWMLMGAGFPAAALGAFLFLMAADQFGTRQWFWLYLILCTAADLFVLLVFWLFFHMADRRHRRRTGERSAESCILQIAATGGFLPLAMAVLLHRENWDWYYGLMDGMVPALLVWVCIYGVYRCKCRKQTPDTPEE